MVGQEIRKVEQPPCLPLLHICSAGLQTGSPVAAQASSKEASTPAHATNGLPEGEEMGQAELVESAVELAAQDAMADVSLCLNCHMDF